MFQRLRIPQPDSIGRRASAPLIAEGFLRSTPDEFVRYLRMARGEIGEVENKLKSGKRKKYFGPDQQRRAEALTQHAMAVTTSLLKSKLPLLRKNRKRTKRRQRPST